MKTWTRADVEAAIDRSFGISQRANILAHLDRFGTEPHEHERERVQAAIVQLSEGSFERLAHFVEVAKKDYRDILYWADS